MTVLDLALKLGRNGTGCLYLILVCWGMLCPGHLALGPPGWMVEDSSPPALSLPAPSSHFHLQRAREQPGASPAREAENILSFGAQAGQGCASGWSFGSVVGQWAALGLVSQLRARWVGVGCQLGCPGRGLGLSEVGSTAPRMSISCCGRRFGVVAQPGWPQAL